MGLINQINPERIPEHVAIIMDGNGRWAQNRKRPRLFGHKSGAESVRVVVETACELGIKVVTLYAFSSENWGRPEDEVKGLMSILQKFLVSELNQMLSNGVRLCCIGNLEKLPTKVRNALVDSMEKTASNNRMVLNLALSYGGRDELTMVCQNLARKSVNGELKPEEITMDMISDELYTAGLPDPDLLIRTGGEERLSNFLLWQASYAEIYFTDTMWPDFRKEPFLEAVLDFQQRERRFGKTTAQVSRTSR